VTAGTVLHNTRTPLRLWFWAAYLIATHHPGISAVQLQRQLGIARHETAWMLLHKLRRAMVAPEREPLRREIELDEFFLGGRQPGLKGGRERGKKTLCGVAVEVRGRGSGRLRLAVLQDASGPSLEALAPVTTEPGAIVHTDGWRGYLGLSAAGFEHRRWSDGSDAPGDEPLLPRAHRAVSNLKAWLHGNPSRQLPAPPAGLPRRVRVPPEPPPHTTRRVSNAARPRRDPPAEQLPRHHRSSRVTLERKRSGTHKEGIQRRRARLRPFCKAVAAGRVVVGS
jgi:hypothetical protein